MEYAINAVFPNKYEAHPPTAKPMAASASYSLEQCKKRILHNELIKIRESIQASDKLL